MENYSDALFYLTGVFGSLFSILLMVNAHFTRETLGKIANVDKSLGILITNHNNTKDMADKNYEEINRLRERLHSIEGAQLQTMEWLKHNEKQ